MLTILRGAKRAIEKISGCRIYRNSLPHGVDCHFDVRKRLGSNNIKTVFDVGANQGQSALKYLKEFPHANIYSFEPVASTYQQLKDATRQFPRVHAYNLGMGREATSAVIHVNPISEISSIRRSRPEDKLETIKLQTLAGFAEEQKLQTIDFLKVDTEGYELEVLAGASPLLQQQRVNFIVSECEPVARSKEFVSFSAVAECLEKFDYRLFGVYDQQTEWDGRSILRYWNALFISPKLIPRN